jgi:hypothetical protein
MSDATRQPAQRYAPWLWVILFIFSCRVIAQFSLTITEVPFLPPFEAWYSGAVPYPQLLALQLLTIIVLGWVAWRFHRAKVVAMRSMGIVLLLLGSLYFSVMVIRLLVGFADLSVAVWFHRPIPSFFHLVLASFILLAGHFHLTQADRGEGVT